MSEDARHAAAEPATPDGPEPGSLCAALVTLAGTPDDASGIPHQLVGIATLSVALLPPVSYASVTAERLGMPTTVAMTSELALAVDQAQYAEGAGPCLEALGGEAVAVDDIAATVQWPRFRDVATGLGLGASLSIPLTAGSGDAIAALNLYGREMEPFVALSARVLEIFRGDPSDPSAYPRDDAGEELADGLREALAVRSTIQRALGVLIGRGHRSAAAAYIALRQKAAQENATLVIAAGALLEEAEG